MRAHRSADTFPTPRDGSTFRWREPLGVTMSNRMRSADEIRSAFLEFFKSKGHEVVPSSGVVPRGDATLLFTNAGMVQFKDVFTGKDKRSYKRAATAQKCIRMSGKHNDLENVGRTARHHTFFEMLGNFSFGDYFKRDAIAFAWELLTKVYKLPPERLVVSVFGGEDGLPADDEARAIWKEVTGFGDDRIFGLGKKDNFWQMGDTGPCGPCTEIHYCMGDIAPDPKTFGEEPRPDGTGWVEIWNNVFMQFDRSADGKLTPLPAQSVDTGMGLERLTAVLQGVTSNYDTDVFMPLLQLAAEISGKKYGHSEREDDVSMRVIADHARLTAVCLSEGVTPSNEGRGSALRSVMRRAVRHGVKLGIQEPFLDRVASKVVDMLGKQYPDLVQRREFIANEARLEEVAFREKIPQGLKLIADFRDYQMIDGKKVMPGDVAFELYATHGFPLDLTEVIGEERGFTVDRKGYDEAKEKHADVSRGSKETIGRGTEEQYKQAKQKLGTPVVFTGYDTENDSDEIALLLKDGQFVNALRKGERGEVIVKKTPFYGESGGQVGDQGVIRVGSSVFRVADTQKPYEGVVTHIGEVTEGTIEVGAKASLEVDHELRSATRRNHSATHLLHWALRKVLGTHVEQRGSKVGPDVLRFDYATQRAMTDAEIAKVEDLVNREVLENVEVRTDVTSQEDARKKGAMMIFEENYGDVVRMLHIGHESIELCGGTHVSRTGDIGLFTIRADEAVGKGTRRIVAATGMNALQHLREVDGRVRKAAEMLKTGPNDLPVRVAKVLDEQRELQKQIADLKRKLTEGAGAGGDPTTDAKTVGDAKVLAMRAPVNDAAAMREYAEKLRDKLGRAVVVLGAVGDDKKVVLICTVSKDLTGKYQAGKILKELAPIVGGGGGGRPDMAQAGGTDASKLDEALARVFAIVT
jgi:alanyl-tRNA synthetase